MLSVPILIYPLDGYVLRSSVTNASLDTIEGVSLLDNDTPLSEKRVYVGTPEMVARAIKRLPSGVTITLMSAGDSKLLVSNKPTGLNLFIVSLNLVTLFNRIQRHITKYLKWEKELKDIVLSDLGLQKLAEKGCEMLKTSVAILNYDFKVLGICLPDGFNDPIAQKMKEKGFLSDDGIASMLDNETKLQNPYLTQLEFISRDTGNKNILIRIFINGNLTAHLIVTLIGEVNSEYYSLLATEIAEFVQQYFLSTRASRYLTNTDIESLVADLIELRLTGREELEERLKITPAMTVENYYHPIIISFEERNKGIQWNYIVSRLERIFPDSCVAVYKDDIIIISKKAEKNAAPQYDREKLMELLRLYDAYLAIGNFSKLLTSLRPVYLQTKQTIRLGKSFRKNKEARIFNYEEYSVYHMIDMCADANGYHSGNLVYLCHPGLVSVERYDKKNGTNLCETLYVYLTNNCNTVRAAKLMYLHRNTMYYKINKIEELIGQSLDDEMLKERLLFSFRVLEYAEKYMMVDPLRIKGHFDDQII